MRRELLASKKKETGLSFRPSDKVGIAYHDLPLCLERRRLGLLLNSFASYFWLLIPLILLLTEKSWKGSVIYFVLYGGSYILQLGRSPTCPAFLTFLLLQSAVSLCGLCRGL